MIYDKKATMDYESNLIDARQEGRQEGKLAGRVQICQELLGDDVISDADLLSRSTEELVQLISLLQDRLRKREK